VRYLLRTPTRLIHPVEDPDAPSFDHLEYHSDDPNTKMCLYPLIKFACCDAQYKPTTPDLQPIVKFCPRGHPDTIRAPFPGCYVREPHECNDFFRLPIKCPRHKLEWLTAMDLNRECQAMDAQLAEAGVSERLRFRYRDKMGRAFEMVVKCAERMEAERLQAWKVKMFCAGAALELLGTAIVGSDARPLDYGVLEGLRERLIRHINAEARQLMEDVGQDQEGGLPSQEAEVVREVTEMTSSLEVGLPPSQSTENHGGVTISGESTPEFGSAQLLRASSSTGPRPTPRFLTFTPSDTGFAPASTLAMPVFPFSNGFLPFTPSWHPLDPEFPSRVPGQAAPYGHTASVAPYVLSSLPSHVEGQQHRGHMTISPGQTTSSSPTSDHINDQQGSGSGRVVFGDVEGSDAGLATSAGPLGVEEWLPPTSALQALADGMEE
jgi:hypothetical protein